jgi:hypothetical protein
MRKNNYIFLTFLKLFKKYKLKSYFLHSCYFKMNKTVHYFKMKGNL